VSRDRPASAVCIVRHGYYPADPKIRREAEALRDGGYAVDVVCLRGPGEEAREVVRGIEVHRLPLAHKRAGIYRYLFEYSAFTALAAVHVVRLHLRRRYRVVQVNTMPDFLVVSALAPKLFGARVVLVLQEAMPELYATQFGGRHPLLLRAIVAAERASAALADRVVTVNSATYDALMSRGIPAEKTAVVMNSADERYFQPIEDQGTAGAADGAPLLVAHGSLLEHFGFRTVIRAIEPLRMRLPGVRLRVIGEGEDLPELRRLAGELGVDDCVEFLGHCPVEELPRHLARADVGIVPNEAPYFADLVVPTKLMEFVAMHVPAVVSRSRAVERYFDESMVRFFEPGNAEELAERVVELAADPAAAHELAESAAAWFLPRYGWQRMKATYLDVIDSLADGSAR
jgi:glycosyltransferase involved in cell wall biosynthesis